jgi:SAM-dependent methyltransferase
MSTLPVNADRPACRVEESATDYLQLLGAARQVAARIVQIAPEGLTGAASYMRRTSEELLSKVPESGGDALASEGAIFECLRRVMAAWPRVAAREIEGERVFSDDPGLWKRAMTDYPMGGFARMAADFMITNRMLGGPVLELGAGVGSCSALVADHVSDQYIRSDLQTFLLKRQKIAGTVERYDFNEPGMWRDLQTIFAVNALHCARDKVATLRHLREMLRDGGALILGEGRPHTDTSGTPWALNPFFGLFRGWWDVGGFVAREDWLAALRAAGFAGSGYAVRQSGAHDLGGVIWAVK